MTRFSSMPAPATMGRAQSCLLPDAHAALTQGRAVIRAGAAALAQLEQGLDHNFANACALLRDARRQVVTTGMGKSGLIARKLAATLNATGTPSAFLHPAEAAHGDMGLLAAGDVLVVLSHSGATRELAPVMSHARRLGVRIVGMVAQPRSPVGEAADVLLALPLLPEACPDSFAPTTSTTMQMAMGDALAMAVMAGRGVTAAGLRALHPGGTIGLRLTPVAELMHRDALPLVPQHATMAQVIAMISACRHGLSGVVDAAGGLVGVISDGDLRRCAERRAGTCAEAVMTRDPLCIDGGMLAADALHLFNDARITAAFVVETGTNGGLRPCGILHIHDLLRQGLN